MHTYSWPMVWQDERLSNTSIHFW